MIDDDVRNFLTALLLVVGGLLPIVNPVGSAPMFLAMTRGADLATRQVLALKIAVNTFILIMGSLIFGALRAEALRAVRCRRAGRRRRGAVRARLESARERPAGAGVAEPTIDTGKRCSCARSIRSRCR